MHQKNMALQESTQEFVESGKYAQLPTEAEKQKAEKELEEANYKLYQLSKRQKQLEEMIAHIPPELLEQLAKKEREARKKQGREGNR